MLEASNDKRSKGSQFFKELMKAFHHKVFQKNIMPKETKEKCLRGHVSIIKSSLIKSWDLKSVYVKMTWNMASFEKLVVTFNGAFCEYQVTPHSVG